MRFALSDEQTCIQEAAARALARHDTLAASRSALDGGAPLALWATATGAGWPGLLSAPEVDGAGLGALEAMLVLETCGRSLADARLLGHLPAAVAIEWGCGDRDLRTGLAAGRLRAALVDGPAVVSHPSATGPRLTGAAGWVLDAAGAGVLVVLCRDAGGLPCATVVPSDSPGVAIEERAAYDATRSLARVVLHGAPATPLALTPARVATVRDLQRALLGAESLGAASACLTQARDHARERVAFGRPIGSYQAIKHKLVEVLRRIENARSLVYYAGWAWQSRPQEFALAANAVLVCGSDALEYAARENIFTHGGLGATWEHDASLYYRRAELSRRLAGGPDAAADAVAEQLLSSAARS